MERRNRPHIVLTEHTTTESFTSTATNRGNAPPPPRDPGAHSDRLTREMTAAIELAELRRQTASSPKGIEASGIYIQFESNPDFELALDSLDAGESELRAVTSRSSDDGEIQIATVFVPDGGTGRFLERFDEYATRTTPKGNRSHTRLVERISDLRLATVRALWTDPEHEYPDESTVVWWEMWLRNSEGAYERLEAFTKTTDARLGSQRLVFDDRIIVLVRSAAASLATALDVLDDVAELRRPATIAQAVVELDASDQADFVDDLVDRVVPPTDDAVRICVLDSGVATAHPLLAQAINLDDAHVADPAWSTADTRDHGTGIAGIALYGSVGLAILGTEQVELIARLESVKILPDQGSNDPALYAAITANSAALVEIANPDADRSFVLAITAERSTAPGRSPLGEPTSWSAAIDALAAGRQVVEDNDGIAFLDDEGDCAPRLFIISAGNVRPPYEIGHLERSNAETAEDPSQSWNAIVVGAYTAFDHPPTEDALAGWSPLSPNGELSPFSRTSVEFEREWRYSPDLLMEGGNAAVGPNDSLMIPESLQVVTTSSASDGGLLATMSGTSPAAAALANMHSQLQSAHPELWPETHRALLVSSGRWTGRMSTHFEAPTVDARITALRRYGWGVPDLNRALHSANDALTLVTEQLIRPYKSGSMREMHLHDLPWPIAELQALGDAQVRMRVSLSYFIQPNPSRRGWTKRYQYASHGLRFAVRRAAEDTDELRARINKDARTKGKTHEPIRDTGSWLVGPQQRNKGSLHVDEWSGTAADLAARGCIAVYPVGGWWKDSPKLDRSEGGVRYSLVVSIESDDVEADLWMPVAVELGIETEVETDVETEI